MRTYILAMATTALFVLPTSAFSQVDVEVGPGGVQVGPGYHRHYDDGYHRGIVMAEDDVESCGKPASTRKN